MQMIDKVMEVLQEQGFLPKREGSYIAFKYQFLSFLYSWDESDEDYFSLYVPCIFETDETNRAAVLEVCNELSDEVKVVKSVVNKSGEVWLAFEEKLFGQTGLEDVVTYATMSLSLVRQAFNERINARLI